MTRPRTSYEDSCRRLKLYLGDKIPPLPSQLPRPGDETCGVFFLRTFVGEGDDLSDLFLPHTFFGRSEINDAAFRNTDLTESNLCWNDFVQVDFSDAVLIGSDLRASLFERVAFVRADLRRTDLRRSSFEDCNFDGALMQGAVLTRGQRDSMDVSKDQVDQIAWTDDEGEEPEGG